MKTWALIAVMALVAAGCGEGAGGDAGGPGEGGAATVERDAGGQTGAGTEGEGDRGEAGAGEEGDGREVVYVDVRTADEYEAGHVEGAIHIPYTEMRERHEELEPYADREIVLYCQSGRRSGIARSILEEEGFTRLVNGGSLDALEARGVPTTR